MSQSLLSFLQKSAEKKKTIVVIFLCYSFIVHILRIPELSTITTSIPVLYDRNKKDVPNDIIII